MELKLFINNYIHLFKIIRYSIKEHVVFQFCEIRTKRSVEVSKGKNLHLPLTVTDIPATLISLSLIVTETLARPFYGSCQQRYLQTSPDSSAMRPLTSFTVTYLAVKIWFAVYISRLLEDSS
jgi:hypothetical protein